MAHYTAAVMPGPGQDIRLQEFPAPELEPGAVLLHTVFSEVCGTDVHLHHGRLKGVPYPIIPGHVSVGRIAEARGPVTDIEGAPLQPGDLVTFLDVHETCNRCWYCLVAKETTRCPSRRVYGITYSADEGLLGGWSQAIWMKPGVKLIRLPDSLPPEAFIGGGCGLVTSLHAVDLARIRLGETVVVLGVGPVGQSAVALAARSGAGQVIAIGDPEDRRHFARRMGANAVVGLELPPADRAAEVRSRTHGRGADVVIEASGAPEAVPQALDLVRDGAGSWWWDSTSTMGASRSTPISRSTASTWSCAAAGAPIIPISTGRLPWPRCGRTAFPGAIWPRPAIPWSGRERRCGMWSCGRW